MREVTTDSGARACAGEVMAALPLIMRSIGAEMHRRHGAELSAPQFHSLRIIKEHDGASLSFVARHLASGLPSASKLIDGLVERGLLVRETAPEDRRRVLLSLTPLGHTTLETFHLEAITYLASQMDTLSAAEQDTIMHAMDILRRHFTPNTPQQGAEK
jgi:DNA-binding MarR family transcriptional regulator